LLLASFTVTESAVPKAVLIFADCGVVPAFAAICVATPGVFVSAKLTVVRPAALAATLYGPPAVVFAVNAVAVAIPLALVVASVVFVPFANVPLAPVAGAVKATLTPATGLLLASLTVTARVVANAVPIFADWGVVPAFAAICVA